MKVMYAILFLFIFSASAYSQIISEKDSSFVDLEKYIDGIVLDVKYATEDNFTGMILYPSSKILLRKVVADSLKSVSDRLKAKGLRLKVFDGYRPHSVQKLMWSKLPDPNYVADPAIGSKHNRGSAVDVTIIDAEGNELDMGTPFDDFTEKASPNYTEFPKEILNNRNILKNEMEKSGFNQLDTEWWHFDFYLWDRFGISDFPLD